MKQPEDTKTIDMHEEVSRRGRKPMAPAERTTDVVPLDVIQQSGSPAAELTLIQSAITTEQVTFSQRIGERIGRRRMASLIQKLETVTDLIELQDIKDSRAYRGMSIATPDGKVVTVTRWEDYCIHGEGRSREKIDLDLSNLRAFGAEYLEEMQRHGIGYRQMRELRQIPETERAELLQGNGDKELTEEVVQDLLEKHKKQISKKDDELQAEKKKRVDAEQSAEAARRVASDKNVVIDHLKEKLERPYQPSEYSAARTETEKAMLGALQEVMTQTNLGLIRATEVMADMTSRDGISQTAIAAAQNDMKWIAMRVAGVLREFGIEFDIADEIVPSWVHEARQQMAAGGRP